MRPFQLLVLFATACTAVGLRVQPPTVSRRRVTLIGAAGISTLRGSAAYAAKGPTLAEKVAAIDGEVAAADRKRMGDETPLPYRIQVFGNKVTTGGLSNQLKMVVDVDGPDIFSVQYVWLKDAASGKIYAGKRFRPSDEYPPRLSAAVPQGARVVPLVFCDQPTAQLWEGAPFTVAPGYGGTLTPAFQ